jgi:hypothetical protein
LLPALRDRHEAAEAEYAIDDAAEKDQQQAGVDEVHRHHREPVLLRIQRCLTVLDHALDRPTQFL